MSYPKCVRIEMFDDHRWMNLKAGEIYWLERDEAEELETEGYGRIISD
jgi:hypothetical protein